MHSGGITFQSCPCIFIVLYTDLHFSYFTDCHEFVCVFVCVLWIGINVQSSY